MKFASVLLAAALASTAAADASIIPAHHQHRFLQERDTLESELSAWMNSIAGQIARKNGFFDNNLTEAIDTLDNHLSRFFLTKLSIETVQKQNPNAVFSVNTPFALMTNAEFARYVARSSKGFNASTTLLLDAGAPAVNTTDTSTAYNFRGAENVDWITGSCVAPVRNQGNCGSCWAFASISAVESAVCLKTGALTKLSEQQLVSCDNSDSGCDGGMLTSGLGYVQKNGGVSTQASYPYTSGYSAADGRCSTSGHTKFSVSISAVKSVAASDAAFVAAVSKQPVAVAVAAGNSVWKQYVGGVVSSCTTSTLDHAVVAVGYDAMSFKIRNSWGASWGENGYIRLKRVSASKAACGLINTAAAYPVIA